MKILTGLRKHICILILISTITAVGISQDLGEDISVGRKITIKSKILNEDRPVFVYLPQGYEQSSVKYPVLYILDGGGSFLFATSVTDFLARNGLMPNMIVVAIPNTNRNRDFTPSLEKGRAVGGGALKFMDFLEKELLPYIDTNYKTQPYRVLSGHSLCGMFSIYTLTERPELFHAYIAMSPYLMYDEEFVINAADQKISPESTNGKTLFITLGNEPAYNASLSRFTKLLKKQTSKEFSWKMEKMERESHGTIPLKSLYSGLEFIFSDWRLDVEVIKAGLSAIEGHYAALEKKYGYPIAIPEAVLNRLGYQYLQNGDAEKAVKVFKENVVRFPDSSNVYDSLGDGLEKQGKLKEAMKSYQKAIDRGVATKNAALPIYQKNHDRVQKKLDKMD